MLETEQAVAQAMELLLGRTSRSVGADFFMAMARGIADTFGTRYGFVGELIMSSPPTVRTLAVWNGNAFAKNFTYLLAGTPCANVLEGKGCHYRTEVAARFPDDEMLVAMGIDSYVGLPIRNREATAVGLVVAMHDAPTPPLPAFERILRVFADRAAAELERMHFEAALARSEARYRQIVSTCVEGVWTIDAANVTTFVNRQMAAMLGYSEVEMLGRSLFDFMDAAARSEAETNLARRSGGHAEHHEFRLAHKQGHDVWVTMAANPLYDDAGGYVGALALATDVTERRRLDAATRQSQKLESLGVLAGGVAHDFNNLLAGILGNAEIALRTGSPPRRALEDIRSGALRAAELTRQLLAFAGKGKLDMSAVDVNEIIADMARLLSTAISKKTQLRFVPASEPAIVDGDSGQLGQVVMNLITNASESLGDMPGTVAITTAIVRADRHYLRQAFLDESLPPGDYVLLEVVDTGCGMDAALQGRIFDPFFTTKFTGRGLGLAALLGVLRAHRGAVRVESEVGRGTTFQVLLPRAKSVPAHNLAAPAPRKPASLQGRTILVADDEALIRAAVGRLLEAEGCIVLEAIDGPQALDVHRERGGEIDLVLLDLTMPGLSGAEVLHELRRRSAEVRVVITSGYAEEQVAARLGEHVATFLSKPFSSAALIEAIRQTLDP